MRRENEFQVGEATVAKSTIMRSSKGSNSSEKPQTGNLAGETIVVRSHIHEMDLQGQPEASVNFYGSFL